MDKAYLLIRRIKLSTKVNLSMINNMEKERKSGTMDKVSILVNSLKERRPVTQSSPTTEMSMKENLLMENSMEEKNTIS